MTTLHFYRPCILKAFKALSINVFLKVGLGDSQEALVVKNLPANAGDTRDVSLMPGQEDPLEEGTANHSSILAWRIPWTEEPAVHAVAMSQT